MRRKALHQGSWYTANAAELASQLDSWLIDPPAAANAKAVVCPHAGYAFCGPTLGHSYSALRHSEFRKAVLLGPSHHVGVEGCALPHPSLTAYETPFGSLPLDMHGIENLRRTGLFTSLSVSADEEEHSLEMQLPMLRFITLKRDLLILPIIVGNLGQNIEEYCALIHPLLDDPETVFIISSDFCHWGKRFRYVHLPSATPDTSISSRIKSLDEDAIRHIENHDAAGFKKHLRATGNTICGQNPILLFLHCMKSFPSMRTKMLHYSQSSRASSTADSSVSYVALATF